MGYVYEYHDKDSGQRMTGVLFDDSDLGAAMAKCQEMADEGHRKVRLYQTHQARTLVQEFERAGHA